MARCVHRQLAVRTHTARTDASAKKVLSRIRTARLAEVTDDIVIVCPVQCIALDRI